MRSNVNISGSGVSSCNLFYKKVHLSIKTKQHSIMFSQSLFIDVNESEGDTYFFCGSYGGQ